MSLPQHWTLRNGEALAVLKTLAPLSVNCIVTSPPYFNLRDYGHEQQLGMEESPAAFVDALVDVFNAAREALADDGTLWLNLGDSYAGSCGAQSRPQGESGEMATMSVISARQISAHPKRAGRTGTIGADWGCKAKDLIGVPWEVAFALRRAGWFLRRDIIWHKPNPMPESIKDRPTTSHEYVFLLTKSSRYWYDAEAIREPLSPSMVEQLRQGYEGKARKDYAGSGVQDPSAVKSRIIENIKRRSVRHGVDHKGGNQGEGLMVWDGALGANARSVWTIPTEPSPFEHFAVMPKALARRCIIAGCPAGGVVLDPFAGMATTGVVALEEGRSFVGIELNPKYHAAARERLAGVAPLLATEVAS